MVAGMFISAGSNYFGNSLANPISYEYAKKIYQGDSPLTENIRETVKFPIIRAKIIAFFLEHLKEDIDKIFAGKAAVSEPCDPKGLFLQEISY